jgi:hypothetical protein
MDFCVALGVITEIPLHLMDGLNREEMPLRRLDSAGLKDPGMAFFKVWRQAPHPSPVSPQSSRKPHGIHSYGTVSCRVTQHKMEHRFSRGQMGLDL